MGLKISDAHVNIPINNMMWIKKHAKVVHVRGFNQIGHAHVAWNFHSIKLYRKKAPLKRKKDRQ